MEPNTAPWVQEQPQGHGPAEEQGRTEETTQQPAQEPTQRQGEEVKQGKDWALTYMQKTSMEHLQVWHELRTDPTAAWCDEPISTSLEESRASLQKHIDEAEAEEWALKGTLFEKFQRNPTPVAVGFVYTTGPSPFGLQIRFEILKRYREEGAGRLGVQLFLDMYWRRPRLSHIGAQFDHFDQIDDYVSDQDETSIPSTPDVGGLVPGQDEFTGCFQETNSGKPLHANNFGDLPHFSSADHEPGSAGDMADMGSPMDVDTAISANTTAEPPIDYTLHERPGTPMKFERPDTPMPFGGDSKYLPGPSIPHEPVPAVGSPPDNSIDQTDAEYDFESDDYLTDNSPPLDNPNLSASRIPVRRLVCIVPHPNVGAFTVLWRLLASPQLKKGFPHYVFYFRRPERFDSLPQANEPPQPPYDPREMLVRP